MSVSFDAHRSGVRTALSRRFVIGSLIALGVVAINALASYRTIANLIEASRSVENTLKVVDALKHVQGGIADLEIELRGYVISGDANRLDRALALLRRSKQPIEALRASAGALPDQTRRIDELDTLIDQQFERFDKLIETHRRKGLSAAMQAIGATSSAASIRHAQTLVNDLLTAEDALLAQRTEQSKRNSNLSVITAIVATAFNAGLLVLVIQLARREIRERRQAEEVVKFAATHDPLTGLPNRLLLAERVNRAFATAKSAGRGTALLFVDLDRFKNINDTLGHEAGDRLLQDVATRLARCVRRSDTVARQGGDEFVVLIETFERPADLARLAEKILAEVAEPMTLYGKEFQITASIGISTFPGDGDDLRALLKNADTAMYRAKQQGKNNYQFYSERMDSYSVERFELEAALRHALERNELVLHYQPKVEARTGRITGIESLLRWQHPTLGLLPPDQVIPLAEETGLIVPIGKWALRTACLQVRTWAAQGLPSLRVAVNLSVRQFMSAALLEDVRSTIAQTGMDPRRIELELTESMMMPKPEEAVQVLKQLKAIGVRLTIDDFGTGYSSLAYLKQLPIDCVKIDASFIRGIPIDASDVAITETIITMSHNLGLKVVAEGVERHDQMRFLVGRGCDEMQGFYFSAPLPPEQLTAYLKNQAGTSPESRLLGASRRLKLISGGSNAER